jgi:hypothetical protein
MSKELTMNENMKIGLFFVLGVAAGALGAVAVSRGNLNLKPALAGLMAGGMELRDKAAAAFERAREEVEDVVAEAEHLRTDKERQPAAKPAPKKAEG